MNDEYTPEWDMRPCDYVGHYVYVILDSARVTGRVIEATDQNLIVEVNKQPVCLRWSAVIRLHDEDGLLRQLDALRLISDIAEDAALPRWFIGLIAREIERVERLLDNVLAY